MVAEQPGMSQMMLGIMISGGSCCSGDVNGGDATPSDD
jgi:hypothetical protein